MVTTPLTRNHFLLHKLIRLMLQTWNTVRVTFAVNTIHQTLGENT
jgi:hypothetical protein